MTLLRISSAADGAFDWSLRDAGDRITDSGDSAAPDALPRADSVEVIVPAARMRTLVLGIPPVVPAKLSAVVRFAVEDQLAGDVEAQHIVVARRGEQSAVAHIVERRWLREMLAKLTQHGIRPLRVIAESDLVAPAPSAFATWVWRTDGGILVQADGRVAVLDQSDDALPSALLLALAAAPPAALVVVRGPDALAEREAAWSRATGVRFEAGPAWSWRDAPGAAGAAASNLLTPDLDLERPLSGPADSRRIWRRALWWLAAALLLHAGASAADWAVLNWRAATIERETRALIVAAAPALSATPDSDLLGAWRRHYATARHRAGRAAPDDVLPLLALAAGALGELPPGALRTINYETGQLTLDFDPAAITTVAAAVGQWERQGLAVLQARTASGLRVRITQP